MTRRFSGWLAPLMLAGLLSACAQPVAAPPPVPPPQAETIPLPQIAPMEQVWRPGHWNWDGSGYRWIPGEYEPRTPQTQLWRSGVWQRDQTGWTWHPPGWM